MLTEMGVNYCHLCGSSNLERDQRPEAVRMRDKREHLMCLDCGAAVKITYWTVHNSAFARNFSYITLTPKGRVIAYSYLDKSGRRRWAMLPFIRTVAKDPAKGMTQEELDFVRYRLEVPESELERQGRLVIRRASNGLDATD